MHLTYPLQSLKIKACQAILAPQFQNDEAARAHLEKTLWPDGPVCPHCGIIGEAYLMKGETTQGWPVQVLRVP